MFYSIRRLAHLAAPAAPVTTTLLIAELVFGAWPTSASTGTATQSGVPAARSQPAVYAVTPRLDTDAISYVRLYAGPDGESHFEDVTVGFTLRTVPPVPPLGVSDWQPAERIFFYNFAPGWYGEPHVAPRRQFVIVLKGATALQASDGEIRHQQVGDVLLAEDTTGKGHATWNEGDDTTLTAVIALPDE
jgi:quercetin dioxygenase-like cupin family protein